MAAGLIILSNCTLFRDEDLRADRQPEFTQLDIECLCRTRRYLELIEVMLKELFKECLGGVELEIPLPRLSYQQAVADYGTDKPDLRFNLKLVEISEIVKETEFKVFKEVIKNGGQVKAINAKGCGNYSRKEIDDLTKLVKVYGAKGLAYFILTETGIKSPIKKFFLLMRRVKG